MYEPRLLAIGLMIEPGLLPIPLIMEPLSVATALMTEPGLLALPLEPRGQHRRPEANEARHHDR
jgi:hypothetical protein